MKQFMPWHPMFMLREEKLPYRLLILQRIAGKTGSAKHLQ
ncbi:hypothetical protein CES86_0209 [Brucella lupini]|uniref:Uncharacterized protein n=1 Tax=Brucella lupini TaxID=255457 RepID=A0A256GYE8_9HYPH|nr:hypothetical protein CES86_0209 [Brucella lupini]